MRYIKLISKSFGKYLDTTANGNKFLTPNTIYTLALVELIRKLQGEQITKADAVYEAKLASPLYHLFYDLCDRFPRLLEEPVLDGTAELLVPSADCSTISDGSSSTSAPLSAVWEGPRNLPIILW